MKRHILYVLVLTVQMLTISACSSSLFDGADSPQEAVAIYHKALQTHDADLLWSVWQESGYEAAKLRIAIHRANVELDHAIKQTYPDVDRTPNTYSVDIDDILENAKVNIADQHFGQLVIGDSSADQEMTKVVEHDRAAGVYFNVEYVPGTPVDFYMSTLEIDGDWYVHLSEPGIDHDQDVREKKILEILGEAKDLVGNSEFTVKEIDWYVRALSEWTKDLASGPDEQDEQFKQKWLKQQCVQLLELQKSSYIVNRYNVNEALADKFMAEIAARVSAGNSEREEMAALKTYKTFKRRKSRARVIAKLCADEGETQLTPYAETGQRGQGGQVLARSGRFLQLSGGCGEISDGRIESDQQTAGGACAKRRGAFWTGSAEDFSACSKEPECLEEISTFRQLSTGREAKDLLVDIMQSGLAVGLEFQLFNPGDSIRKDLFAELPIEIKVTGEWQDLQKFIEAIAQLQRAVTIDDIRLSKIPDDESQISVNATVRAYIATDDNG